MKKLFLSFIILCFISILYSCSRSSNTDAAEEERDTTYYTSNPNGEMEVNKEATQSIWTTEYDTIKNDFVLVKNGGVNRDTISIENIIQELNSATPEVKLQFLKKSKDTVFIAIPESTALTQQMGSSGAVEYIAKATFNITELDGIKYVNYNFKEGDHLSPGTWSRENFKRFDQREK